METLKNRAKKVVARQTRRLARIAGIEAELGALRDRVAELEVEVQESRRLNQRLAELTDVVTEVLVPAADRDDAKIRDALAGYNRGSF